MIRDDVAVGLISITRRESGPFAADQIALLEIFAAFFWGATTVYIKKFMAEKIHPINTFLYQLFFSIPILLVVSLVLEPRWSYGMGLTVLTSLFYQSVIVAFISYFVWFKLIHEYSVSRLSTFTFFTPVFGVSFGILFLNEELTVSLMVGLPMVSLGIFFVNWRRRAINQKMEAGVKA